MLGAFCTQAQNDQDAMKKWQAFMTPSDVHKMLAKSDGQWDEEVTMWMAPGAPAEKSKASCENKMIMNGLYQQSNHKGNMMGMPFEGMSILGFDNARKVFVSSWIDNMGSGIMNMEGTWDAATQTVNFKGTGTDPMTGNSMPVRETFKIVDDNTQVMEMYVPGPDGKEFKTMEIKFTRHK